MAVPTGIILSYTTTKGQEHVCETTKQIFGTFFSLKRIRVLAGGLLVKSF